MIKINRVYDKLEKSDGFRILVDRLWPRGLSKDKAKVDLWLRDIAPTDKLRKWFSHDVEMSEFHQSLIGGLGWNSEHAQKPPIY